MNAPIPSPRQLGFKPSFHLTSRRLPSAQFAQPRPFSGCCFFKLSLTLLILGPAGWSSAQQSGVRPFELPERIVNPATPPLTLPGLPLSVPAIDTPGGEIRIDGNELHGREILTVEDTFRNVPGLYARSQFSGTNQARLIIRGFGLSGTPPMRGVRLLQDGIPMTLPDGQFLPQNIDLRTVSSVDVYRGPASLFESVGSLGGAVNFNSFTAATAPSLRLRAEAGSYDNLRWHGLASGTEGAFDGIFMATHASQKGYRVLTAEDDEFFGANAGWKISDDSELRLFVNHSDVEGEMSGPQSVNSWRVNPRAAGTQAGALNVLRDQPFREIEVNRAALQYRQDGERFHTELSAWLLYADYRMFRPRATEGLDFVSTAPGVRGYHQITTDLGGLEQTITFGGEVYGELRPTRRVQLDAGQKGVVVADHDMEAGMAAFTLGDQIKLNDEWKVGLTLQPQHHWRDVSENLNGAKLAQVNLSENFDFLSGRAEASWSPNSHFGTWAAISFQEEPPILDDLVGAVAKSGRLVGVASNSLNEESAWTGEIGVRGKTERHFWDVTIYRSDISNEIIRTRPPAGPDVTLNAKGDTIHQGIEAMSELALVPGPEGKPATLSLLNSVNVSDFFFDDPDFKSSHLPAVPDVFFQTELLARHPEGWFFGAGMETAPDGMYVDYANTVKTPGYTIFNLRAGRQIAKGMNFYISLDNIFDQNFINSVAPQSGLNHSVNNDTAAVFSGQGQRWQIGIEYNF